MTTADGPLSVRFSHRADTTLIAGLSAARAVTLGACVLTVAIVLVAAGVGAGAITAVGISPLAGSAILTADGRALIEWTPIAAHYLWRGACGQLLVLAKPGRPRPVGTLPLPGDAARLAVWAAGDGTAIIHDPYLPSWTAVAAVHGGGFLLADADTQNAATAAWGRTLAARATGGQISRIQLIHRTQPDTGAGLQSAAKDTTRHTLSQAAADAYTEAIAKAGASWRHETLVAITLSGKAGRAAIRKNGHRRTGVATALAGQQAALADSLAAADATIDSWLTPADLAAWIRTTYDPASSDVAEPEAVTEPAGGGLGAAGPMALHETWNTIHTDTAWHRVLWIDQWPRADTHPAFLAPLLLPAGAMVTVCLLFQPIPTVQALRQIGRDKTAQVSDAALRQRLGTLDTAAQTARQDDTAQREADITAGHADMRHTAMITITADGPDGLDDATARIRQAAASAGCETRVLYGQQLGALTAATLPIGRGL